MLTNDALIGINNTLDRMEGFYGGLLWLRLLICHAPSELEVVNVGTDCCEHSKPNVLEQ